MIIKEYSVMIKIISFSWSKISNLNHKYSKILNREHFSANGAQIPVHILNKKTQNKIKKEIHVSFCWWCKRSMCKWSRWRLVKLCPFWFGEDSVIDDMDPLEMAEMNGNQWYCGRYNTILLIWALLYFTSLHPYFPTYASHEKKGNNK